MNMGKEFNNLQETSSIKNGADAYSTGLLGVKTYTESNKYREFNKVMETTNAITQTDAFLEAGIKFLQTKSIDMSDPNFGVLLHLYVETAKNSYKTALDACISGVKTN